MDRRLFLTTLLGVVGTAAIASALPHQAEALAAIPSGAIADSPMSFLILASRYWNKIRQRRWMGR